MAKNIRYLRRKHNYSQEYLAEKLGYKSYTTIQKWEMGVSEPSVATVRELADLFHVDMNDMTTKDIEKAENSPDENAYYFNEETAQAAQEIFQNKELRALFDVQRDMDPEDLKALHDMALALKRKERGNGDAGD
ncbi:MAG: helix-turn-helix domain-containing protein [Bacteroidales bacterium]|nr:helix-turn-helix domain-containing protein [Bacteroidales bacterium]